MADNGPSMTWITDPKLAFFYLERRVSPPLEEFVRTEGFLDALTVVNSVTRIAGRAIRGGRDAVVGLVGLPTGRQVARLTRAIEEQNR